MNQDFFKLVNKEFIIVFNPKDKSLYNGRRYFIVKAAQLANYIGKENAENALLEAMESRGQRWTRKYRKHGYVMFYVH